MFFKPRKPLPKLIRTSCSLQYHHRLHSPSHPPSYPILTPVQLPYLHRVLLSAFTGTLYLHAQDHCRLLVDSGSTRILGSVSILAGLATVSEGPGIKLCLNYIWDFQCQQWAPSFHWPWRYTMLELGCMLVQVSSLLALIPVL